MIRRNARLCLALVAFLVATPSYIFSAVPVLAASDAQRAYDACVDAFNDKYRFLDSPKAMVAGLSNGRTKCFWNFGGSSVSNNIRGATSACEAEMGRCFLWHDSSAGDASWVALIDSNGGTHPDETVYSNNNDAQLAIDIMNQAITTLGIINGGNNSTYSGGGGDDYSPSGGGSVCTPAQIARGWSEERCALN
jgi:hypothetical protein